MSLQGGLTVTGTTSFKGKIHADSISTSGGLSVCGSATIRNAATVCGPLKTTTICHRGAAAFDQSGNADFFAIRSFGRVGSDGGVIAGTNFVAQKTNCGDYRVQFQKGIGNQKPTVVLTTSGSSSVARIIAFSDVTGQGFRCHIISGDGVRKSSGFSFMALG